MKFNYQARTKEGEAQSGTVEAPSRQAAFNLLQRYGLFLTALEEAGAPPIYARQIKLFSRISRRDIVLFSRQLAIMFRSKVSLVEALRTMTQQTKNIDFKDKILDLVESVEGGTPFSQALKAYPKFFSPFYVAMVKSGEVSGNLSEVLDYLADHLEKEYHFYSKLRSAMIYPALIVFVALMVMLMMVFFVIPNLADMLQESKSELPLITRAVIGFSHLLRTWGWLFILLLAGLVFSFWRYSRSAKGKKVIDKFSLKLPLLGNFLKMVYLSRFAGNLSVLIAGGLPIARALEITADIAVNTVYKKIILESREGVRRGVPISSVLSKYPETFSAMFCQMTLVGERTGTMDKTLLNVVDFFEKEVDRSIDMLLAILEPALIMFLGLMVAGLMSALLLPLYKLMSVY